LTAGRFSGPVCLIVNPGARRASRLRDKAVAAFSREGIACDVVETRAPGHAAEVARARRYAKSPIFTLGGDGTAMEVIGALAGSETPVGILPGGTGNLLARTLGVPLRIRRAVPILLHGDEARIDLGVVAAGADRAVGRRFAFATGVGIDAAMIEGTPRWLKRRIGVAAYALTASRALLRRELFPTRITADGEVLERNAAAVMVANFGAVMNEMIMLGPGICHDDGLLDLCVFSPGSLRDSIRVLWRLFRKDFRTDPCLLYRRGSTFRIETTPPRAAQADGELLGSTPLEVTVEPLAARLLVPKRKR
jgi:diacylglycerol kinase (ATP)